MTDQERIAKLEELVMILAFPVCHLGGLPAYEPEKFRRSCHLLVELGLWSPGSKDHEDELGQRKTDRGGS